MALSSHELYLVLRARDEASRVLRSFGDNMRQLDREAFNAAQDQMARGQALATAGVAIAGAGLLGIQAINGMTDASMAYNEQVALTQTQLDGVKVSFQQLSEMGKQVAQDIPVQFEEVQASLYDIFSSIETDAPGARILLEGIARASVGGATSMETAGRAAIAILNAYKRPATDINAVNDTMFQLVRKGVGTYEEFTSNIGKVIPSAVKAGQSVEDLSGVMAFLTRNGLSTAMAATSSARAFDAMAKPATIERFEKLGVMVTDANGQFRPMADIMGDLRGKMADMNAETRAATLNELFKGSGGTLQAMRFFNLAVEDSGGLLQTLTGDMHNAGGAAAEAYAIMANTPQAQLQQMSNRYEVMKTTIGEQLLPAKLALVEAISKLINMFLSLSPETQATIARFAAFASVAAVIVGVVTALAGLWLMFSAAVTMAGTTMAAVLTPVGLIIAGLIALAAVVYLVWKNWDTIKAKAIEIWGAITAAFQAGVDWVKGTIQSLIPVFATVVATAITIWQSIVSFFQAVWSEITDIFGNAGSKIADNVSAAFSEVMRFGSEVWGNVKEAAAAFATWGSEVWNKIQAAASAISTFAQALWSAISPSLIALWNTVREAISGFLSTVSGKVGEFGGTWESLKNAMSNILSWMVNIVSWAFQAVWVVIKNAVGLISGALQVLWAIFKVVFDIIAWIVANVVWPIIQFFVTNVIGAFQTLWTIVTHIIKPIFTALTGIFIGALGIIKGIFDVFAGIFTGDWSRVWEGIKSILRGVWDAIYGIISGAIGLVIGIIRGLVEGVINWFKMMWDELVGHSIIPDMVNGIINWIMSLRDRFLNFVKDLIVKGIAFFINLGITIISTVANFVSGVISFMASLPGRAIAAIASLGSRLWNWATDAFKSLMRALIEGHGNAVNFMRELPGKILSALGNLGSKLWSAGRDLLQGLINGITSKVSGAVSAVTDAVSRVIDGAKNFLGISSPSKVFDWIGRMTGMGLINGLKGMRSAVASAGAGLAGAATMNISTNSPVVPGNGAPGGPGFEGPGGPGFGGDSSGVTQNFYITTQEIDPRKHAADLGWELAVQP